ncbi:MAG: IgGFc-binding protein, partial [Polyangiaceae bacterium]|nr:IgGFc-binding protein [Polyangiaceae bacterium]
MVRMGAGAKGRAGGARASSWGLAAVAMAPACSHVIPMSAGVDVDGGFVGFGDAASLVLADASTLNPDPQTCDEAAKYHSYVGCDYWPTVTANNVWSIFDFAVVVANAGSTVASVTVTGPSDTNQSTTVAAGAVATIYLPWVASLKGGDTDNCGRSVPFQNSVLAPASAFHLVSTAPVTVYQFNALEYRGMGGPPGKSWQSCPGLSACTATGTSAGCYSFSNDASLLLPSTAMTGNYRVAGHEGVTLVDPKTNGTEPLGGYMAITATADGTTVTVQTSENGPIAAGQGVDATPAGGTLTLAMNAGDVAELVSPGGGDLSGGVVTASAPVQLITGHPCQQIPPTTLACDHMEESVFPSETLGKDYVVTRPAGPGGTVVSHQVRFFGNFDGTHLAYAPSVPPNCPTTLNAGDVVECGVGGACPSMNVDATQTYDCGITDIDFEVTGDQPFAVSTFTLGSNLVDPMMIEGDPAQSAVVSVEQYRTRYVFL